MTICRCTHAATARPSNQPTITVIVGGSFLSLTEHLENLTNGIVIVADAPAELSQHIADRQLQGVHFFPLAAGQTALTLAARASQEIRDCLRQLPGIDLSRGMGQYRAIGSLAAQQLLDDPKFHTFLNDELPAWLIAAHGTLSSVRIEGKAGLSGGTGSDAVQVLVEAIRKVLLRKTDAVVSVHYSLIGAITSSGLGNRVVQNAAAATVDMIANMQAANFDPRESRSAQFVELPPVGPDRTGRDALVLLMEQALASTDVQEVLQRRAPNQGLTDRYGNLTILRPDFYCGLHPRLDVAAEVATRFAAELRDLAQVRIDRSVQELEYLESRRPLPQEPIDSLVQRALTADFDDLYQSATQPDCELFHQVRASLKTGVSLNLSDAVTVFALPPASTQETRDRLTIQRACLDTLSAELTTLGDEARRLNDELARADGRLKSAIDRITGGSASARFLGSLRSAHGKLDSFAQSAGAHRQIDSELRQVQSKTACLEDAYRQVQEEHEFLLAKLASQVERLESLAPPNGTARTQSYVESAPLDDLFAQLWQFDEQSSEDMLARLLGKAVRRVTLAGIAKVVGADLPRLEVIASRIAGRCVCKAGPSWGGKERHDAPLTIHVLPPLARDLAEKLRQLILREDPRALVAVADMAVAGVNCVDLNVYSVENPTDLVTGFYAQEYVDVLAHSHRALYVPREVEGKAELGMRTIEGRLTFTPKGENSNDRQAA
jgi:hypothetical protein